MRYDIAMTSILPKTIAIVFGVISTCSIVNAQIIPISISYQVSASGWAVVPQEFGGQQQSYSLIHSQTGNYTSVSDSVGGSAFAEITILPPFDIYFGTELRADSAAAQSFAITSNAISLHSSASANTYMYSQVGSRVSMAEASIAINFEVIEPAYFSITGFNYHFQSEWPYVTSSNTLTLSSLSGPPLYTYDLDNFMTSVDWDSYPVTGILGPGQYTLSTDLGAVAYLYPYGEVGVGRFDVTLATSPVPDAPSTLILLAVSTSLIALRRTKRFRAFPPEYEHL